MSLVRVGLMQRDMFVFGVVEVRRIAIFMLFDFQQSVFERGLSNSVAIEMRKLMMYSCHIVNIPGNPGIKITDTYP